MARTLLGAGNVGWRFGMEDGGKMFSRLSAAVGVQSRASSSILSALLCLRLSPPS